MTPDPARLLFDECLGRPAIEGLAKLVAMGGGEKPEIRHVLEFAPAGTRDEVWIPKLAPERWTVITADGARKPNRGRGKPLPEGGPESRPHVPPLPRGGRGGPGRAVAERHDRARRNRYAF